MSEEKKIVYTPDDLKDFDYNNKLGDPGCYPYTRAVYPTMYTEKFWTMRQYAGFSSAAETNERFKLLLEKGQTGLSTAFDLPTQMGYDSDHEMSAGEVGKVGVAVSTIDDMRMLFNGIPLEKVSTSMTINASATVVLAMYMRVAREQGGDVSAIRGTVQNDILKEYVARGNYIYPVEPSMRLNCDLIEYSSKHLPKFNTISISGYHIREAGSTAVQELAFTFADAFAYVDELVKRGIPVDKFAPRLSFFFAAHNDFLEEIAKFRAARRIWAKMMKEKYNAQDPKSMLLRFHTQTGGSTLTAQQPKNNIVRVAYQALAAVLGGTQSLHTNSFDEALALPTEESVTIALRTQQLVAYESGVTSVVDPLAGSYYIESLTDKIEAEVLDYLDRIERMGGTLKCLERGYFQSEIGRSAYKYQMEVENEESVVVGVNKFTTKEESVPENARAGLDEIERAKVMEEFRAKRDEKKYNESIEALREKCVSGGNLMEPIIDCVNADATLGEICGLMRDVWGEYIAG
ncbi:MAG TPA: methylmalonyl-CoA mutase family protein [Caldisericia bacterium]|nr:methylmalonyl-CoA mutase family protein [Caldisericia bacterium]HPF48132.1 methylmalonyl-CoA mutase family protein [Caldisericia bacterium]HPI83931.1 methylmalonyl-CoA mutase family protein [Caldisericia bacterium]HPQ92585.1 methylmalonyl-CoA mutase family protein [Caldisericia bacterium]HRV74317.1 methylmalonyl-CoA mutase family protein [Caldisericia bacterium]